jgi:hypothetical protein
MSRTAAYSLLPTSSSGSTETFDELEDLTDTWPLQRPTNGWAARVFSPFGLTNRPSRLFRIVARPHAIAVAAFSTLCTLALITSLSDHLLPEWMIGKPLPLRGCFELPADELVWQTTQLPTERSLRCPFDPESFVVLDETAWGGDHKVSKDAAWSNECLEAMLADGEARARSCDSVRSRLEGQNIDLVWTWVNGSSPLLELTRRERAAEVSGVAGETETMAGLAAKLFR